MALLNSRLLELIETLVAARLDWLAFELIEGIRAGRPPEDSEEELAAARVSIREDAQPLVRGVPHLIDAEPAPISPDEQIEWAAAYVEGRLGEALEQLLMSIDSLDYIADGTAEQPSKVEPATLQTDAPRPKAVAVLLDQRGERKSASNRIASAHGSIPALRAALVEWTAQAGGQASE